MEYLRWRLAQLGALTVRFRVAWRFVWRLCLGDLATNVHDGRRVRLMNGPCAPSWEVKDLATGERLRMHERDMRKVRTLANCWGSFRSGWRWYGYHFEIEVGRRMGLRGAYYGTEGARRRRQRRRDREYASERGA